MGSNMEAIDCSETLTANSSRALKNAGIVAVGRYLGKKNMNWWKSISLDELHIVLSAGLSVFLIWEGNPTYVGYFSYDKGVSDAQLAVDEAVYLGAPNATTIYFAVDYDAQPADMSVISGYFRGVRDGLFGRYLVGVYGSHNVMTGLQSSANPPDKYFQTYAWSGGQIFDGNHIFQYQNDITVEGVAVDRNKINGNPGTWPELGGGENTVKKVVVYFSSDDYSVALIAANANGGCAMFNRNRGASVNADALAAEKIINIGGPKLGVVGEIYWSGNTAADTAQAVLTGLKGTY